MRRIVYVIVIAAVLVACSAVFWFFILPHFQSDPLSYDDTIHADTKFPVRIVRDRYGVPEIISTDRNDLLLALGYIHAQDRLNTMEYYRAISSGLADRILKGDDGRMLSRLVPLLGVPERSREIYAALKETHRNYLDSYVKGINAWKARSGHVKYIKSPPDDRPWSAEDVISLYLLREWGNAFLNNRELLFPLTDKKYNPVLEDFYQKDYITLYKEKYYPYVNILSYLSNTLTRCIGEDGEGFAILLPSYTKDQPRIFIHQQRAECGFPLQYPVRFSFNKMEYCAASEAGTPFLSSVISEKLTFSTTSSRLDSMDFYIVPVEKRDGDWYYQSGNQSKPFEIKNSRNDSGSFSYRVSDFGPVISDIVHLENETICVVVDRLKGNETDITTRLDLPFMENKEMAVGAISLLQGYPRSFLISSGGEGLSLLSGTIAERIVKGIFFHDYVFGVRQINLSSYRSALRQPVISSSRITESAFPGLREYTVYRFSEKEDQCVESMKNDANIASLMRVINSSESLMRERISHAYDKLLSNLPVTSAKLSKVYLSEWKGDFSGREISATIANQMFFSLMIETLGDELAGEIDLVCNRPSAVYEKLAVLLEKGDSRAFDNISTVDDVENMDKIFNISFIKAMRILHRHYGPEMGNWRWDRVGRPKFDIPFVRASRFSIIDDSFYDDSIHYSADISYSGKGNSMHPITISDFSLLRWGDVYWGANFPLSLSAGSEYYGNTPIGRRMLPFISSQSSHTITMLPSGSQ